MKITFSNRPPPTVPCTPAERHGDVLYSMRYAVMGLSFVTLGTWSGVIVIVLICAWGDFSFSASNLLGFVFLMSIFFWWITVPWALLCCLIYWAASREIHPWTRRRLLAFCEIWGVGQALLLACDPRVHSIILVPILLAAGVVAGLVCWPISLRIWWRTQIQPHANRPQQMQP